MLSQTSEHAIRAVLYLAQQPRSERVSAEVIARALEAPQNYMGKTLNVLAKAGVLGSMRGPSGGFWLRVPAEELTLAEVIGPFEEEVSRGACLMGGGGCDASDPCSVHSKWKTLSSEVWAPLRGTTVAELLGQDELGKHRAGRSAGGTVPAVVRPAV